MDKYEETFETWNKMASLYEEKFMDLDIFNESYDSFLDALSGEQNKVLEFGCGPGNITRYLLQKRPDLKILGTDIAPNMIELARKNNPGARFEVMDGREIGQLEEKFDGIVGGFCLPYFSSEEAEKLIVDAASLLNKRGVVYLSFVDGDPGESGFKSNGQGDRVFIYYHRMETLKKLLAENGFEELKIFQIHYLEMDTQRIFIASKR